MCVSNQKYRVCVNRLMCDYEDMGAIEAVDEVDAAEAIEAVDT